MSFHARSLAGQLANGFWSRMAASCGHGGRPDGVCVTAGAAAASAADEKHVGVDSQGGMRQKRERDVVRCALSSRWTADAGARMVSLERRRAGARGDAHLLGVAPYLKPRAEYMSGSPDDWRGVVGDTVSIQPTPHPQ